MMIQTSGNRSDPTDNDRIVYAEKQMLKTAKAMESMAESVAAAKQVKEFSSDRHKRLLAIAMKVFLDMGESAAASECKARASEAYGNGLITLAEQYQSALETIEKHDATRILWESNRSLLSCERAKLNLL